MKFNTNYILTQDLFCQYFDKSLKLLIKLGIYQKIES